MGDHCTRSQERARRVAFSLLGLIDWDPTFSTTGPWARFGFLVSRRGAASQIPQGGLAMRGPWAKKKLGFAKKGKGLGGTILLLMLEITLEDWGPGRFFPVLKVAGWPHGRLCFGKKKGC